MGSLIFWNFNQNFSYLCKKFKKKVMNKPLIKFWDKIIVVLLGIVGLSSIIYSCSDYGMRMTTYEIVGKVTNKKNGKPIENIRVTKDKTEHFHSDLHNYSGDTLYTNSKSVIKIKAINIKRNSFIHVFTILKATKKWLEPIQESIGERYFGAKIQHFLIQNAKIIKFFSVDYQGVI